MKRAFYLIIFLIFHSALSSFSQTVLKKPYVVLKFDDLTNTNWKNWKPITDLIIANDVTADCGLFVKSLNSGDQEYMKYVKSLLDDPKHFGIWLHGYTGEAKEFFDTDYATQFEHFQLSRTVMLNKFDYILRNYGPHYYGGNEHTVKIINEDPFLKGWIFQQPKDKDGRPATLPDKQVMPQRKVNMEPATAVVRFSTYETGWKRINADTLRFVVLQGHPWGYKSDTLKNEFIKVIDDLKAKGVTFTHFRDYDKMVKGYSTDHTPPSVPTELKAVREGDKVKLTWNASVDNESGVDCYKIYRDGVCVELSATTSYADAVNGKHNYQVSAVNNNDLVSEKSSKATSKK
jgi:hypothetical protein